MTEAATATESTPESTIAATISEPKLWAGKYKTVEDLEEAYKNNAKIYNENVELKKKVENITKIPDDYSVPDAIALRQNEINEIKVIAKNAGLTQEHFEKMAREMEAKIKSNNQKFEEAKKAIGDEQLNVLNDYVQRNYPESIRETVLNKLIQDKNAMTDALKDRDAKLNSQVPGLNQGTTSIQPKYDGYAEMVEARNEYVKNPNERNRSKYIDLARQVGEERYKDKQ